MYIYTLNNNPSNNGVVVMETLSEGRPYHVPGSPFATGGLGLGFLEEQGAVRIHGGYLLAVNPGSHNISVFRMSPGGQLAPVPGSPFPSGGFIPASLATRSDGLVYVANQGYIAPRNETERSRNGNITGFHIDANGRLTQISGSTIQFIENPRQGPAQVEFSPTGGVLALTQLNGQQPIGEPRKGFVRTYAVQPNGTLIEGPGSPLNTQQQFNQTGPQLGGNVGFSWTSSGSHLLVTGFGGSTVTVIPINGTTAAQSPPVASVPNGQSYACWTALSPNGQSLYVTNPGNNTVSAYGVATGGQLTLRGSSPPRTDPAAAADLTNIQVSPNGQFLYVLRRNAQQIALYVLVNGIPQEYATFRTIALGPAQNAIGLAMSNAGPFELPAHLVDTPVRFENLRTSRYILSDGSAFPGARGAEGGWLSSPGVVGADDNYYNRALWIFRRQGNAYLIENFETKRYLFSDGTVLSSTRGSEGGFSSAPNLLGSDSNYYNRALWDIVPVGDAFLLVNRETKRLALCGGPGLTGARGAEGGWLSSSGFASPRIVGADLNYDNNRALWRIIPTSPGAMDAPHQPGQGDPGFNPDE